ncbi:cache domain-containing sensor histidine kinase [Paenibacillus xanthanilyticus]|uniref:Sensor histidine kinase n=1 Tax=Paenibacillus xanthanilyticus TaxID=1783531 RepID=A0ABV8K5F9_9BACL
MKQATLRSRLILGFSIVTVPLALLLLWNNQYATKVVHSQVAQSNQNLLTMYMNDMDKALEEIQNYLYRSAEQNEQLLALGQYKPMSWNYYLAQTQTAADLNLNTNYYDAADLLFAYSQTNEELIAAQQHTITYERKGRMKERLLEALRKEKPGSKLYSGWNIVESDGSYGLVRVVDTNYGSSVGAWVNLDRLMQPMRELSKAGQGEAVLVSSNGEVISALAGASAERLRALPFDAYLQEQDDLYNIVELSEPHLLVAKPSRAAGMTLLLLLPERKLLENLPLFRYLTYVVPLLALALLIVYLIFLQRAIVTPIHQFIKGMRKIRAGDLSARLEAARLVEFTTMKDTFNGMAEQIKHLKIDIYEERIRTQEAELRHLQAQIHPHFFMNSLNIVYQLAQIRSFDIIQSIALHLVNYFRYTTRTQVSSITLKEELEHSFHYLSIQKHRFPNSFDFEFALAPELETLEVPPLIVQPMVENAVIHGFKVRGGEPFKITVTVRTDDEAPDTPIVIEVSDNGKGLTGEQIDELTQRVQRIEAPDGHIGLWNVARRCRLYYQTGVRLSFERGEPHGALVRLGLPRIQPTIKRSEPA